MSRALVVAAALAGAPATTARADSRAEVELELAVNLFAIDGGGFVEPGACAARAGLWQLYACLWIDLGYQSGAIVTDAGELGARFQPSRYLSITLGAGSSVVVTAIEGISCVVDSYGNDGDTSTDSCSVTSLPLHAYPALGLHAAIPIADRSLVVSVLGRYYLSASNPEGLVRAPRGPALALGIGTSW